MSEPFDPSEREQSQVPSTSRKRKNQNLDRGDRFCCSCGELIWAQSVFKKTHCFSKFCRMPQPLMSNMYAFSNGVGRCSETGCGVLLTDTMNHCYYCGFPNKIAQEKKLRESEAQVKEEKRIADILREENAKLKKDLAEKEEIIVSLDNDYFVNLPPAGDFLEIHAPTNQDGSVSLGEDDVPSSKSGDASKGP